MLQSQRACAGNRPESRVGAHIIARRYIYGMRGLTCSTLFGLIAATGLRISEALGLDPGDLDADTGVLRVRRGKLGVNQRRGGPPIGIETSI